MPEWRLLSLTLVLSYSQASLVYVPDEYSTKIDGFLADVRHVFGEYYESMTEVPDDYTIAEHESRPHTG